VLGLLGTATGSAQEPAPDVAPAAEIAPEPSSASAPASSEVVEPASTDVIEPSPPAAPAPSEPAALTEAELAELGFSESAPAVDTSVQLSGFIDFSMAVPFGNFSKVVIGKPAFGIGNLNVYLSKYLTESIRTMVEVRLLYLPNGIPQSAMNPTLVNTAAADYADFNRNLRWGGVEIERVYLDWAPLSFLTLRVGQFLTPYGVWNVDHGTPTIVPIQRPFVIGYNFFPERQTGFELHGRVDVSNYSQIGYHLTLSNGTGPATEYKDLDANKAIGGRLFWEYRALGELRVGGSIYYGRDTDLVSTPTLSMGEFGSIEKITTQSDSLALALDATFKYRGIQVQAEFITRQLKYTDAGRTLSFSPSTMETHYSADSFRYGSYLLLGYRFNWFGVMPYVVIQRTGGVDPVFQQKDFATPLIGGVNIRPIDELVLKIEYAHVLFDDDGLIPDGKIQVGGIQLAWAF
jgi:hypothetical protein